MEEILLAWLQASYGRLSGIHGWQREHVPIAFEVIDSTVIIHFEGSERLIISDAVDIHLNPYGELVVNDVSEVRFTWCSDKDASKECEETFGKAGRGITFSRTDDLYTTSTFLGFIDHDLIVLRYEH